MAYVRKVRTASGAVAVQVARKVRGRVQVLAHLGSAHTDAELGVLLDEAHQILRGEQQALQIEVAVRPARIEDVADWRTSTLLPAQASAQRPPVGPGRTTATSSRLLYDVLGTVYDWLGFDAVADPVFRDLVIARIVAPTSRLDSLRVLADLGAELVSYKTIDRHARMIAEAGYRDVIAGKCFDYATDCGGLALVLYDVTTLYFEAENEDALRKVGFSNYAEVPIMPRSWWLGWCSSWSTSLAGMARAA